MGTLLAAGPASQGLKDDALHQTFCKLAVLLAWLAGLRECVLLCMLCGHFVTWCGCALGMGQWGETHKERPMQGTQVLVVVVHLVPASVGLQRQT